MFERLVADAVSALPMQAREAMKNVAIVIERRPRHKKSGEVGIKRDEVLLGLYEGIPLINRDSGYFGALPDKITIFQQPIEAFADGDAEKMTELVREVVWHEIGHHFGLNESELHDLEEERKRKKP
ncbi:MAG: metallopeptidase family protein [Nitrospinae bacterium]|nr:metallopeptidase family protein [Nitrospinota bacterium]